MPQVLHQVPRVRRLRVENRRGMVLVFVVVCLIPLMACLALAIDMGILTLARTQISDAADSAALAGARTLNGDGTNNNNYSNVTPNAQAVITSNAVMGKALTTSQLSLNIGRYAYNSTTQQFEGIFPGTSGSWNLVQATVTGDMTSQLGFSKLFGFSASNIQAQAAAAHRPRDICLILDYSGSMRFASLVGTPYSGNRTASNNMDTNVPAFGAYSASNASLVGTMPSSPYDTANITATTSDGRPPVCADFYTNSTGTPAWTPASNSYATTPGGDNCLKTNKNASGNPYAQTLASVLNIASPTTSSRDATFETSGYKAYSMNTTYNRYTQGPNYWGKTFFIWPPDPSNGADGKTNDWRKRYFYYYGTTNAMDDNSKLWDSSGNWLTPGSGYYSINYTAILDFIKNIGPSVFPSVLQSGRIRYYSSIPTTIDTSTWPPTDLDQRFWKEYIDYCLGIAQTGSSSWLSIIDTNTAYAGYGYDYAWGTIKITAKSSLSGSPAPYMHYGDNPARPRLHFWFGPLSMVDFMGNYNMWYQVTPNCSRFNYLPGTCHEAPIYACKLGISAALTDIKNNHPSDFLSLIMFSIPQAGTGDDDGQRFNRVRVALGQNYTYLQDALWYPPTTYGNPSATVSPYDSHNLEVPRAMGGTCYSMALMLAYNQFSGNTSLQTYNPGQPSGDAGGNGRKGAQKIIIFETDGAPNTNASATFVSNGAYQSYYKVRYNSSSPGSSEFPTSVTGYSDNNSTVTSQIYALCTQLAAADSAGGYSSANHPVLIHCLAFGPQASGATATLVQMQTIGNVTDGMPSYKVIDGSQSQNIADLQTAIGKILQDGVQVSLIQ